MILPYWLIITMIFWHFHVDLEDEQGKALEHCEVIDKETVTRIDYKWWIEVYTPKRGKMAVQCEHLLHETSDEFGAMEVDQQDGLFEST